jgi:hypothetical protein
MNTTTSDQLPMFNLESQKQLARLLAKENISIRVGNYNTAFFDVKNRVLGLPAWNVSDKNVADLLVGHEVGHACFTPHDAIDAFYKRFGNSAPFDVANVVEDIRIERMIMDAFPGLISPFREGYRYFIEKDFFKIAGKDINALPFVDRLNIKGKLRDFVNVQFTNEEAEIHRRCLAAETYDEVLDICADIISCIKTPSIDKIQTDDSSGDGSPDDEADNAADDEVDDDSMSLGGNSSEGAEDESESEGDEGESSDKESNKEAESEKEGEGKSANAKSDAPESEPKRRSSPPPSITQNPTAKNTGSFSMDEAYNKMKSETLRSVEDQLDSMQTVLTECSINEPTKSTCMKYVVPIAEVRAERKKNLSNYNNLMTDSGIQESWNNFKVKSKSYVSLLVKEFERRKSAYEYSRATQSALGQINVNKLHAYRYDDNIFKTVSRLATAKNHGMLFFVDFSSSMEHVIGSVVEQTLQLVFFCKAVNIPFAVYGFTQNYHNSDVKQDYTIGENIDFSGTTVFEIINSTLNKNEYEETLKETYINYCKGRNTFSSNVESMSGTPLYQTIVIASFIAKEFREKTGVQKLNTVFISDGDGCRLYSKNSGEDKKFTKKLDKAPNRVFNWKKHKIELGYNMGETYTSLIKAYKAITGSTTACFFIPTGGKNDFKQKCAAAYLTSEAYPKIKSWGQASEMRDEEKRKAGRDSRFLYIKGGFGFDGYFVLNDSRSVNIQDDGSFGNDDDEAEEFIPNASSRNKLAREFTKHTSNKKESRVFLTKFVEMIS